MKEIIAKIEEDEELKHLLELSNDKLLQESAWLIRRPCACETVVRNLIWSKALGYHALQLMAYDAVRSIVHHIQNTYAGRFAVDFPLEVSFRRAEIGDIIIRAHAHIRVRE
jgi:hypothetical protein